ncbi:hypothetical protein ACFPYI_14430 [Halomarina salina]|uniref:LexA-binding, inner membrane-associated hydrolase n=1 Tax=Halomarina salina TaxID=1872699 RepID=A0ABD5RQ62_9EURY|nr:hypothetical protein [Halomarina salina]
MATLPLVVAVTRWIPVAMLGGFFAALVMDLPMSRLEEGTTPSLVAAGVLYDRPPATLQGRQARAVHYTAGILAGVVYAVVALLLDTLLPPVATFAEIPLVPHLLAGLVTGLFLYGFFALYVLPRFGGGKRAVAPTVRRSWALSVAVYVLSLWAFVPLFSLLLA